MPSRRIRGARRLRATRHTETESAGAAAGESKRWITRAGTPATIVKLSTSCVTTAPAATTQIVPIVTP